MNSPVPIENAPATSAAVPVSTIVCADTPPPPRPAISEAFVTRPSTAPNTVGRSQPPATSRCPAAQPAASAAVLTASDGSGFFSSATCQTIPGRSARSAQLAPPERPGNIQPQLGSPRVAVGDVLHRVALGHAPSPGRVAERGE